MQFHCMLHFVSDAAIIGTMIEIYKELLNKTNQCVIENYE